MLSAKTNANGRRDVQGAADASRARRKIRAAECSDVERLSVKPARQVVAQRVPRVTG